MRQAEVRRRKAQREASKIIQAPIFVIGEMIPWKGNFWKVVDSRYDGEVRFVATRPTLVLEIYKETEKARKRREAVTKIRAQV